MYTHTACGIAVSVVFGKKNFVSHVEPRFRRCGCCLYLTDYIFRWF